MSEPVYPTVDPAELEPEYSEHRKRLRRLTAASVCARLPEIEAFIAAQLALRDREIAKLRKALEKINDIRSSIIGLQGVNWSEHIYPLVDALNEAGMVGLTYEDARPKIGTMLERTLAAESERDAALARVRELEAQRKSQVDIAATEHDSRREVMLENATLKARVTELESSRSEATARAIIRALDARELPPGNSDVEEAIKRRIRELMAVTAGRKNG